MGLILKAIQERVGFIGKIVVGLLGVGWSIATYLVAPVLAARDVGPFEAIRESAELVKDTWGENLIGQAGIGAAFRLHHARRGAAAGIGLVMLAVATKSVAAVILAAVIAALAVGITVLVQSALSGIYSAALYRYATTGEGTTAFNKDSLQLAFAPK